MRYFIYPYKQGSASAKALSTALGGKVIKREGSRYKPRDFKKVVNWGSSDCPYEGLNPSWAVKNCSNKLDFFNLSTSTGIEGDKPRCPDWTVDKAEAQTWLGGVNADGTTCQKSTVGCRKSLTGSQGRDIIIVKKGSTELPDAPLYVKYIYKDSEFRVHVFNGEVIDVQRKVADKSREVTDWKIRSHGNGFKFIRRDSSGVPYSESAPGDVLLQAKRALDVSGLVFGAVDLVVKDDLAYTLEINSAPGLEGATVSVYADAIRKYYEG